MFYTVKNVTLNITQTSGDMMGESSMIVDKKYKEFFEDGCGMKSLQQEDGDDDLGPWDTIYEHEYGPIHYDDNLNYVVSSPDHIIAFLAWLFTEEGHHNIDVEYDHPYWAIHDSLHALNDESGCTIYVDADIERQRINDAFDIMIENNYTFEPSMLEDIENEFSSRFSENIELMYTYYYDLLESDEEE